MMKPNNKYHSSLQVAVCSKGQQSVTALIKKQDPLEKTHNHETLLHLLMLHGNGVQEKLTILLEYCKDQINEKDIHGNTCLLYALKFNKQIVDILLQYGANLKLVTKTKPLEWSPVLSSAKLHEYSIFEHLVAAGFDITVENDHGDTLLHILMKDNVPDFEEKFHLVIQKYADMVNVPSKTGWYPIHYAAQNKTLRTILALVEVGATILESLKTGETLLHLALKSSVDVENKVEYLLPLLKDYIHLCFGNSLSPAEQIVRNCRSRTVEHLIQCTANVEDFADPNKESMLVLAIEGNKEVEVKLKLLTPLCLPCWFKPFKSGLFPFQTVIMEFSEDLTLYMTDYDPDQIKELIGYESPIETALKSKIDREQKLKYLNIIYKQHLYKINENNLMPLHVIIKWFSAELTNVFFESGISSWNKTYEFILNTELINRHKNILSLAFESKTDRMEKIEIILKYCPQLIEVEDDGYMPIYRAILDENTEVLKTLIKHRANPNCLHEKDIHPILLALKRRDCHLVDQKLDIISPLCKDWIKTPRRFTDTALYYAASRHCAKTMDILLQNGADINIAAQTEDIVDVALKSGIDIEGKETLFQKVLNREIDTVHFHECVAFNFVLQMLGKIEILSELNLEEVIFVKDREGNTLLHRASERPNTKAITILMDSGADPTATNNKGLKAIEVALNSSGEAPALKKLSPLQEEDGDLFSLILNMNVTQSADGIKRFNTSAFRCPENIKRIALRYRAQCPNFVLICEQLPLDICKELIRNDADINCALDDGETALHACVKIGSVSKLKMLLKYNVDVTKSWFGLTAVMYCVLYNRSNCLLDALEQFVMDPVISQGVFRKCKFLGETRSTFAARIGSLALARQWITTENIFTEDATGLSAYSLSLRHPKLHASININIDEKPLSSSENELTYWYQTLQNNQCIIEPAERELLSSDGNSAGQNLVKSTLDKSQLLETCDLFSHKVLGDPTKLLCDHLIKFLQDVSDIILGSPEFSHLTFQPTLTGSMHEETKTFLPDEADVICQLCDIHHFELEQISESTSRVKVRANDDNPWCKLCDMEGVLDPVAFTAEFCNALCFAIKTKASNTQAHNGPIYFSKYSLQRRDKIPCLHLLYRADKIKDMELTVDLVLSIPNTSYLLRNKIQGAVFQPSVFLFSKVSRRHPWNRETSFLVSFSDVESKYIRASPQHVRKGYIYAKSLRYAKLPIDPDELNLIEPIAVTDFLTSYLLKTSLLYLLADSNIQLETLSPIGVAVEIYSNIIRLLQAKRMKEGKQEHFVRRIEFFFDRSVNLVCCNHREDMEYDKKEACCLKINTILKLCATLKNYSV